MNRGGGDGATSRRHSADMTSWDHVTATCTGHHQANRHYHRQDSDAHLLTPVHTSSSIDRSHEHDLEQPPTQMRRKAMSAEQQVRDSRVYPYLPMAQLSRGQFLGQYTF